MSVQETTRASDTGARVSLQRRETLAALAFISPWFIGFLVFTAGPMIASLGLSLTDYDVLHEPNFIGLANYQELLEDPRLGLSLGNTVYYAILHVPLSIAIALALAMLLNNVGKASGFFRTAFYLPSVTPAVAIGTLWSELAIPSITSSAPATV